MKCKKLLTLRATVHDYKHAELQHTRELKQEIDTLIWKPKTLEIAVLVVLCVTSTESQ